MIVVLGLLPDKFAEKAVEYDLTPTVDSYSNAKAFSDAAVQADRQTGCFVAVDSGMIEENLHGTISLLPCEKGTSFEIAIPAEELTETEQ